jgi:hypothetical protein
LAWSVWATPTESVSRVADTTTLDTALDDSVLVVDELVPEARLSVPVSVG